TLSLQFQNGEPSEQPNLPTVPGLQVVSLSASQNIQMINRQTTRTVNYEFTLRPTKEGEITIPALSFKVGNQTLTSQPLKLTVSKQPVSTATNPDGTHSEAFLKLVVPKSEVYFGEIMPVEIRLYFQNIRDVQLPELNADGFTMTPMDQRPSQSQVQVDGRTYNMAVFRFTVSPVKTGTLKLGPAKITLALLSEPRRDFFGQTVFTKARQTQLVSEEVTIRALPVPQTNRPATYAGAIGRFDMKMSASPTSVAVGDPITVRIQISGRGTLESLKLPEQPEWRDFRIYTPSSKLETRDALGLEGTKTFELVVSPQNAAVKMLPPFEFSFFDPEQKAFRTLSSQDTKLEVRPSALTPQPTIANSGNQTLGAVEAREIVHIKPQLGSIQTGRTSLVKSPVFWMVQAVPPGLWIAALLYRRRKENLNKNPRLRR
ncbi:MAG: BatD family protein, partial [Limisphaerales bacterium]